ncbi:UPF0739 protein C1orf74 homolog [Pristis pectinata]|uniref:UPF0739 protein C1orf74 homolog n=1 Tax=Pristis pectinata TaxID=685728 RepID=UPI00223CC425|nr:UPF0739 protein C1orf74 homolog [Pristis pectinata]
MEAAQKEQLIFMTQKSLRLNRKKRFSESRCLQLLAEVLTVDLGLKPAFLFDYCSSNAEQIQKFVQELWKMGFLSENLHILSIQDNILIINLNRTIRHLERALQENGVQVIDVSVYRDDPQLAELWVTNQVKAHLDIIWKHLKSQVIQTGKSKSGFVTASEIFSSEWNLCTVFGFLLGFPVSYWFDFSKSFENCLSMTELRAFSFSAFCPRITKNLKYQMYSFSVPEILFLDLQSTIETWQRDLQSDFNLQSTFSDLCISTEAVCLPGITL